MLETVSGDRQTSILLLHPEDGNGQGISYYCVFFFWIC